MNSAASHWLTGPRPVCRTRTLWLAGLLHVFTHLYQVALMPLYLLIQRDLHLPTVELATALVTIQGLAYCLPSYPMGWLSDHFSRKRLLVLGLVINALGFIWLSQAANYQWAVAGVLLAGLGGSFFHPPATSIIIELFPEKTGRALGLLGVGASLGFLLGPNYSGWRAGGLEAVAGAGAWRAPVFELGLAGLAGALAFGCWATEPIRHVGRQVTGHEAAPMFPSKGLWLLFVVTCLLLVLRDFAGGCMGTLGSLFMQKAHGASLAETGLAMSGLFLASVFSNPLFGRLSDASRHRWLALVLAMAAMVVAGVPWLPRAWLLPGFLVYGFFFLSSYPMTEAALLGGLPESVRGRVFGLFITITGGISYMAHWVVGAYVGQMGEQASRIKPYQGIYLVMAALIFTSLLAVPCLKRLGRRGAARDKTKDWTDQAATPA